MIELHCELLKRDTDSFSASMESDADRKGGQKTKDAIIELIRENPRISSTAIASALDNRQPFRLPIICYSNTLFSA